MAFLHENFRSFFFFGNWDCTKCKKVHWNRASYSKQNVQRRLQPSGRSCRVERWGIKPWNQSLMSYARNFGIRVVRNSRTNEKFCLVSIVSLYPPLPVLESPKFANLGSPPHRHLASTLFYNAYRTQPRQVAREHISLSASREWKLMLIPPAPNRTGRSSRMALWEIVGCSWNSVIILRAGAVHDDGFFVGFDCAQQLLILNHDFTACWIVCSLTAQHNSAIQCKGNCITY